MHAALALLLAATVSGPTAFTKLKTLEGTWKAESKTGTTFLTLKVVSNGTALLETATGKDRSKIATTSIYSLEGDALQMTHYSAQGNQPHLTAKSADEQKISFVADTVGNLKDPKANHVTGVTISFTDPDHFTQEWTQTANGKESKVVFDFTREYLDTLK